MDGVITLTMPYHFKAWKVVLQEAGVFVTYEDIYTREGQRGIHSVNELFAKYQKPINPKKAKELLDQKEKYFKKIVEVQYVPGARLLLKELSKEGFRLALVTGTSRHELHQILPKSIYSLFEVVTTGNDVIHGKPHPEPFLKTLKALKVHPKDAVVIENAPFGIRSAKAAGLQCFALETSLAREYLHQADHVFASIKDLKEKVKFIFKI